MEFRAIFIANSAQLSVRKEQLVIRQTQEITGPRRDGGGWRVHGAVSQFQPQLR